MARCATLRRPSRSPLRPVLAAALATAARAARTAKTTRMPAHQARSGRPVSCPRGSPRPAAKRRRRRCRQPVGQSCRRDTYSTGSISRLVRPPAPAAAREEMPAKAVAAAAAPRPSADALARAASRKAALQRAVASGAAREGLPSSVPRLAPGAGESMVLARPPRRRCHAAVGAGARLVGVASGSSRRRPAERI